jgi:hypothetical protein
MSDLTIDLDAQIENLRGLKSDLEEHYWTVAETSRGDRYAFGVAIAQLGQRITALEEVVRHHGGDEVTIGLHSLDESRAIDRALAMLDGEFVVEPGTHETRIWPRVRHLLAAADELLLATARGVPAQCLDHDSGPRPGVVLPLVRSSR